MSDSLRDTASEPESLSALVDGEAMAPEVARACAQWRENPQTRERWHRYHLIGDVMRSEDLAQADQGAAFLNSFRERLAREPVVLAPSVLAMSTAQPVRAAQAPALRKRVWAGPLSVAAGIVMVVGALVNGAWFTEPAGEASLTSAGSPLQMAAGGGTGAVDLSSSLVSLTPAEWQTASVLRGQGSAMSFSRPEDASAGVTMVRDPQLDGLLRGRHAGGVPESFSGQGGLLQQVGYEVP